MKLTTTANVQTNIQAAEKQQFSIAVNAKAFRTLLDGLYTNKIRAVVRELWTNAFDSHLEAQMGSIPFDCHLPTMLNPVFSVRDYGVSLTHDQVMNLYTRLFDSTKDQSNEAVGAFGLGSKSPFAYTDSFTVIARLNGRKRTYICNMDTSGTPEISLISDIESNEAQGLEVALAVDPKDFDAFKQEANFLAVGFDPTPSIDGAELTIAEPKLVAPDGSAAIFLKSHLPFSQRVAVRQGCVIYPVDDYHVGNEINQLLGWEATVIVDVPIGAVEITPSREALSLTDATKKALKDYTVKAIEAIRRGIDAEISKQPSYLAAVEHWFISGNRAERDMTILVRYTPKWNGRNVNRNIDLRGVNELLDLRVMRGSSTDAMQIQNFDILNRNDLRIVWFDENDKVIRANLRWREFASSRNAVGRGYQPGANTTWRSRNLTKAHIAALKREVGLTDDNFIYIGDLPDPGPQVRGGKGKSANGELVGVRQFTFPSYIPGKFGWRSSAADCVNVDMVTSLPAEYLWYQTDKVPTKEDAATCWKFARILEKLLDGKQLPVYGMSEKAIEAHKPDPKFNLKEIWTKVYDDLAPLVEDAYFEQQMNSCLPEALRESVSKPLFANLSAVDRNIVTSVFLRVGKTQEIDTKVKQTYNMLKKQYPLLFGEVDKTHAEWYIEQVDNHNKKAKP